MSEQQPQPTGAETGSVSAASDATTGLGPEPVLVESPTIAPDQEPTSPKPDAPKVEAPKETPKAAAPEIGVKAEKAEAPRAGKVLIMSPGERMWTGDSQPATEAARGRRVSAMAAVVALAAIAGAIGGALATSGLGQGNATETASARNVGLEAAVARIDSDILALKASVEQTARLGVTQFNKTSDRIEKVEKAQLEPATRLARLSEEVGKLRAAQAAATTSAAAAPAQMAAAPAVSTVPKDVTGSIAPPASGAAAPPPASGTSAKTEVARLPTVEGWVLRDVGRDSALIEGRRGVFEIFTGDSIPGVGRVDAIRKQDGRWVVVTSKGLIVSR
ncbi:hypothetical protein [Bradyrhizobium sp.]|uniref:hypothetical protein n=1 Tax=Bradyrhizobium sp. TaxID=376 RepID=UPI001D9FEC7E|nr:hypothetical protein [Bradyrhizobium sp.]MBI5320201.1 hypothetical protein [Bradyrhizobium sp.]